MPTALELLVEERPSKAPLLALAALGTAAAADGKLLGYWINGFDHKETPAVLAKLRASWGEPGDAAPIPIAYTADGQRDMSVSVRARTAFQLR